MPDTFLVSGFPNLFNFTEPRPRRLNFACFEFCVRGKCSVGKWPGGKADVWSAKLNSIRVRVCVLIQIPNCRHLVLPYLIIECTSNSCHFPQRFPHIFPKKKPLTFIARPAGTRFSHFSQTFSVYNLWSAADLHAALVWLTNAHTWAHVLAKIRGQTTGTSIYICIYVYRWMISDWTGRAC